MAVAYMEKEYIYRYAKEELEIAVPSLQDCCYSCNAGVEWLKFYDLNGNYFTLAFHDDHVRVIESSIAIDNGVPEVIRNEAVKAI